MSHRYGVVLAQVEDNQDPNGEGRVRVSFPWMTGEEGADDSDGFWAPVATFMSGPDRGSWFMPEVGDEVLVAFDQGDVNHPYVVGFLWNGAQPPPSDETDLRLLRSVNGHEVALQDGPVVSGDQGGIRIEDAQGNRVELSNARIVIQSVGQVEITAPTLILNGRAVGPGGIL